MKRTEEDQHGIRDKLRRLFMLKRSAVGLSSRLAHMFAARSLLCAPVKSFCFFGEKAGQDFESLFKYQSHAFIARKQDWLGIAEIFLEQEYDAVDALLADVPSPKVLDLGANIGGFALRIFGGRPDATIVSVEPAADTYAILERNKRLNPHLNWVTIQAAIWKSDTQLVLDRQSVSTGHRVRESAEGESVPGLSLGTLLKRLGWEHSDLIKMDIEGAEESVVPPASELLAKVNSLIIEVHTDRINPDAVCGALSRVFDHCWRVNSRTSSKPLFILSNQSLTLQGVTPISVLDNRWEDAVSQAP
jgi:FkbM family methyltransferase